MIHILVHNLSQWRVQARHLLMRGIAPTDVYWEEQQQSSLLFNSDDDCFLSLPIRHSQLTIPQAFFNLAESVACFREHRRWSVLYSVAWRLVFDDKALLGMTIDPQVSTLLAMQKSVNRDKHKMAAFVRFKRIESTASHASKQTKRVNDRTDEKKDTAHYVAWFEPEHFIVRSKAPFFRKRFSNMNWSILTPDLCAHWNQRELTFTEGMRTPPNIDDDLEHLWLTYYQHIFNPARLKIKAMQSEMPKKYWINLPEARLIKNLISGSSQQTDTMIEKPNAVAFNKITESYFVKKQQTELRRRRKHSEG